MELNTVIIILASVAVTIFIIWLLPKLNINTSLGTVFEKIPDNLNSIKEITETINLNQDTKDVIKSFIEAATVGVNYAEKLYKSKDLPMDERKDTALQMTKDLLKLNNIEVDSRQEKLIQSVIDSVVFTLPKTHQ